MKMQQRTAQREGRHRAAEIAAGLIQQMESYSRDRQNIVFRKERADLDRRAQTFLQRTLTREELQGLEIFLRKNTPLVQLEERKEHKKHTQKAMYPTLFTIKKRFVKWGHSLFATTAIAGFMDMGNFPIRSFSRLADHVGYDVVYIAGFFAAAFYTIGGLAATAMWMKDRKHDMELYMKKRRNRETSEIYQFLVDKAHEARDHLLFWVATRREEEFAPETVEALNSLW